MVGGGIEVRPEAQRSASRNRSRTLARQATEGGRPLSHLRSHREWMEAPGREPAGRKLGDTPWGSERVIQPVLELRRLASADWERPGGEPAHAQARRGYVVNL